MKTTCTYKLSMTETFRRSSSKVMGYWGTNLQNPPDRIRQLVKPDKGKVFIQVDQSGADALIVAYLCPDGPFRQLFHNRIKPHVYVAMHVYKGFWNLTGHPYVLDYCKLAPGDLPKQEKWKNLSTAISRDDLRYFIGKKICHSLNYRMRAETFRSNLLESSEGEVVISLDEAKKMYDLYHSLFPEISRCWWVNIEKQLNENRTLTTLQNYPRYFGGAWTDEMLRKATAFVPQATVAIISGQAVINFQSYIEEEDKQWDLLNEMHDSYLVQCPEEQADECKAKMLEFMQQDLVSPRGEKFTMRAAASIGRTNWGKYKQTTNEGGMKDEN